MAVVIAVDVADAVAVPVRRGIAVAVAVTVAVAIAVVSSGSSGLELYDESSRVVPKTQWPYHERAQ